MQPFPKGASSAGVDVFSKVDHDAIITYTLALPVDFGLPLAAELASDLANLNSFRLRSAFGLSCGSLACPHGPSAYDWSVKVFLRLDGGLKPAVHGPT
jgi:hypothetical protein